MKAPRISAVIIPENLAVHQNITLRVLLSFRPRVLIFLGEISKAGVILNDMLARFFSTTLGRLGAERHRVGIEPPDCRQR